MPRLALATLAGHVDHGDEHALLVTAFAGLGIEAMPSVWDDPHVDWAALDAVVVRSTWDYVPKLASFRRWLQGTAAAVPVANPAAVIGWNSDKRYLVDLERRGVPIVDSVFIAPGDRVELPAWPDLVVKPSISAGARMSGRFTGAADRPRAAALVAAIHAEGSTAIVQPYVDLVDTDGEADVLMFGGVAHHAVAKGGVLVPDAPPPPDERLAIGQWSRPMPLTDELEQFGQVVLAAVLDAVDALGSLAELVHARVDSVVAADGTRRLMEVELVEPYLFLDTTPEPESSARAYAEAVGVWLATC